MEGVSIPCHLEKAQGCGILADSQVRWHPEEACLCLMAQADRGRATRGSLSWDALGLQAQGIGG